MLIRAMAERDFGQVHALLMAVHGLHVKNRPDIYRDGDPFDEAYLKHCIADDRAFSLVAEEEKKVVGFCRVTLRAPVENPVAMPRRIAYMEELCVHLGSRHQGVGTRLFERAQALARQNNADAMEWMVWSFNEDALRFYQSVGGKNRSVIMEKKL